MSSAGLSKQNAMNERAKSDAVVEAMLNARNPKRYLPGLRPFRNSDFLRMKEGIARQRIHSEGILFGGMSKNCFGSLIDKISDRAKKMNGTIRGVLRMLHPRDLAKAEAIDEVYLGRVLRLTLLAPNLVEAILAGTQPTNLELHDLLKPFPVEWDKQPKTLARN